MPDIKTSLDEIRARAERANGKADCILRRYARVKLRSDVPRLVAALGYAVTVLHRQRKGDLAIGMIEAILEGRDA